MKGEFSCFVKPKQINIPEVKINMVSKRESFWTKNFILLLISNALLFMIFDMLVPTLPLFAQRIGCNAPQIGMVVGSFTISAMLIRLFASRFMLLFNKKYILLVGILLCMLATACYELATGFFALIAFRLLHGLGHGVSSTYFATMASEELPYNRLGEGMGYFGVGETVCMSVAPIIGLAILNKFNFTALFIFGAFILLLSAIMLLCTSYKKFEKIPVYKNDNKKAPIKLIEKRVLPQCILILIIGIVISGVMSYLSIYAEQQKINNVAWFFFIAAISGIFIRIISGKVFDRKGPIYVLLPCGICLIIAMILIAYSRSELMLNTAGLFYGVAFGAIFPVVQAWVISKVDESSREEAVSSFLNFFDLGLGVGSLILGIIIDMTSYKSMYLTLILFIAAYMGLSIYIEKSKRKVN